MLPDPVVRDVSPERGLFYGDGCFRTVRISGGECLLWRWHRERLISDCRRLALRLPAGWEQEILSAAGDMADAVLRITVTRSGTGRGYRPVKNRSVNVYLTRREHGVLPGGDGLTVRICNLRLARQPALAGIKHLNRLEQVLASAELERGACADEGLLLDAAGKLIGGTMSNLFLVRAGELHTPRLHRCGIVGAMREWVREHAASVGMQCHERDLKLSDLRAADEVFLTNTVMGIRPVTVLQGRCFRKGPVVTRLQALLGWPFHIRAGVQGIASPNHG